MKNKKLRIIVLLTGVLFVSFTFKTMNAQLTNEEKEGLIYMYEEEKLAHDVYLTLSEKYTIPVFKNITKSEAYHMKMVLDLIKKYELKDPAGKEVGKFENQEFQKLYNELIEKGSKGIIEALTVGATIEDVDIYDLEERLSKTKNEDIVKLYKQLICGSENHMRAFTGHLKNKKNIYTPKYLEKDRFEQIINGKHKKCFEIN